MGKGGPLAFLNKKPWHPANGRNQEDIWKREQAFMAEVEKREELRRHIEEQREEEGFNEFVAQATKQTKEDRVEWMYQGGFAAQEEADKRKEEYLLGKTVDQLPETGAPEPEARVDEISAGRQPGASGVDFGANETWNRLNADPLLLIKRNEVSKVKAAVSNPYLVQQIKEQLRAARDAKREKKAAKKKERKEKKSKKSSSRKHSRRDESRSVSTSPSPPPKEANGRGAASSHRSSGARDDERPRPNITAERDELARERPRRDEGRNGDWSRGHSNGRDVSRDAPAADEGRRPGREQDSGGRKERGGSHSRRRDSPDGRHDNGDSSRRDDGSGSQRSDRDGERSRRDGDSASRQRDHDEDILRHDGDNGSRRRDRNGESSRRDGDNGSRRRDRDAQSPPREEAREAKPGYGLQGGHVTRHAAAERSSHAELTCAALDERRKRKRDEEAAVAERAAAARRSYRPGQLSKEEREARRREMEGNAGALDAARARMMQETAAADAAEADANAGRALDADEFAAQQQRKMLESGDVASLEGQVRRNRARLERSR